MIRIWDTQCSGKVQGYKAYPNGLIPDSTMGGGKENI